MNDYRILLVEDDTNLGFVIKDSLSLKGYQVTVCTDGEQGMSRFLSDHFHLCLLDVMLPKKDGFTLAKEIRAFNKEVPILFLTAKSMTEDKLEGFQIGGDDYIVKPFSFDELLYRIEVFLRRSNVQSSTEPVSIGHYAFDYANLKLILNNNERILTQREADILKLLIVNHKKVLKREDILKEVWGDDDYFMGRSLDVFISKLRKYLKDDPGIQIVNYHGIGFKIEFSKKYDQ
jgi:DNA-binding response OmpR family regulator